MMARTYKCGRHARSAIVHIYFCYKSNLIMVRLGSVVLARDCLGVFSIVFGTAICFVRWCALELRYFKMEVVSFFVLNMI